ncbi:hypothetical protein DYBT9275_05517 [Dyadobacter sp. CECT 9275]|uniref:Uncharacterized protein n=1 Tax=Dyadobacter helix TaxID=2822344 RepID=A0A916JI00_9BACT|nr:hypothetical protein DYBT9275_05517 [Dyadobacter sp. CECT 9275]
MIAYTAPEVSGDCVFERYVLLGKPYEREEFKARLLTFRVR